MIDRLKELFKIKSDNSKNSDLSTTTSPVIISEDTKRRDETYTEYGLRICGRVEASLEALTPFLSKVYHGEKNNQVNDQTLQEEYKHQLQNEINSIENEIIESKAKSSIAQSKISDLRESIEEYRLKLVDAKNKIGEINKTARVKLIVGLIILIMLTVYLVIFYSSTFYSAFFRDVNAEVTIGQAIFDAHAIPNALKDGFGEFIFIISAPIIFMGLGYGLHFFMEQKSKTRFLKAGSVLLITLIFDCILAYLIAKKLYDVEVMMKLGEYPDFSAGMAIRDINVWAVIFCGFIVYIIWGIVFDMVMTAYGSLRSNKSEIQQIEEALQMKRDNLSNENQHLIDYNAQLATLENKKEKLVNDMARNVHFDIHIIKVALTDFFSGWMTMMSVLNRSQSQQTQANSIYETTINTLFPD